MNAEVGQENDENDEIIVPNYECSEFSDIAGCFNQMHRSIFEKIAQIEKRTKIWRTNWKYKLNIAKPE